jgi:UDP-GlcNAc3NAcA epimerase
MKLVNIVGARPQFIKAAVISRAIKSENECSENVHSQVQEVIVHTGQHYDENMDRIFFEELHIPTPQYNLGIGSGSHGQMTGKMLEKVEKVLLHERPDGVIVYGDTNSTLAGALAAVKLYIPLVHIEAGLRSFNRKMPEEINRVLTDTVSNLLFCPTQTALDNLAREKFKQGVYWVGDVMYDSFLFNKELADKKSIILKQLKLTKGKYVLATVHREENTDNRDRLESILNAFKKIASDGQALVLPVHPRTRRSIRKLNIEDNLSEDIRLIFPVGYLDMICLMSNARVILTDSGGVQKEAYFAKVPCITLRNETEWPETLSNGWNHLAGTEFNSITEAFKKVVLRNVRTDENFFGEGCSGKKIVQIIRSELN